MTALDGCFNTAKKAMAALDVFVVVVVVVVVVVLPVLLLSGIRWHVPSPFGIYDL